VALIRSTKQSFVSDTQPIPAIAPAPRFLDHPQSRDTWTEEEIEEALQSLRGEIDQVPPMYSAKKVAGKKLYELARRGETVERATHTRLHS
jgi:hypothetical protein